MLGEKSIVASDRRYRQSIELLRARAWLAGRDAVSGDDLFFLQHVLWSEPDERREVVATLRELLLGHEEAARVLVAEAREVAAAADRSYEEEDDLVRAVVEALTKLRRLGARTEELLAGARGRGRTTVAVEEALGEIAAFERDVRARHVEGEEH
jgi:MoxR-like ATPase